MELKKSHYIRTSDKANPEVATDGGTLEIWDKVWLLF
jgi:hypothetical protein